MLKAFSKTTTWMMASLVVAASGFGQTNCCPPPKPQCCPAPPKCCPPVCPIQLIPAYNHPAEIETRCSWDVWADASFTYWQAIQENMEVGVADTESSTLPTYPSGAAFGNFLSNGKVIDMAFKYKPGFKVGAGVKFDYDDWDAHAEYTWFRSKVHVSSDGPATNTTQVGMVFAMVGSPSQDGPATAATTGQASLTGEVFSDVYSKWTCNMDIVDATMGRWYYVGTKLQFHTYSGARAQWIRQKSYTQYTNSNALTASTVGETWTVWRQSNSWAVGPEVGLDMNWMMGEGFRLFTCAEADVVYTRYTKLSNKEQFFLPGTIVGTTSPLPFRVTQTKVGRLRTHLDLEMGLGWGTYLDCHNWYLDLSAQYGFQVFFDQNMFRKFVDAGMLGASFLPNGNLYVQGMTATVALHF